ncbi:Holliday junction branch migration protein RuvA [Acidihalobacter ferrooxydans]|uniref:Holliday junction branch migration complex subunit RuvA n=1 Tax=Acidihalobacter ferrooxydans TaxID=1765967 RepID=A0A1P8UHQ7_9GAMM|nr:Holliday junction branch migration protein RuvA [Acidihalobacter ferrooxydans]APZ43385.1 Holliday junction branch migration protein RuvA [Acidihalobacter ferrooxydans]
MIGRLRGTLLHKRPPHLLLEVGGVGYEVEAPMSTFYALPETGAEVVLHTHLQVREDAHNLYGFAAEAERALFRELLKVNGVGARVALAILSGMDAASFTACVQAGDTARLTRLPGIGKKTAERLIIELRDRPGALDGGATVSIASVAKSVVQESAEDEAVNALIALGYKPQEASRMIAAVKSDEMTTEDLIRQALKAAVR